MIEQHDLVETLDVGFFRRLADPDVKCAGRLSRDAQGRILAIVISSSENKVDFDVLLGMGMEGDTLLFSGERDEYFLLGVRWYDLPPLSRGNLLGGFEMFVGKSYLVKAVFIVKNWLDRGRVAINEKVLFTSLELSSGALTLWVGLTDVSYGLSSNRSQRRVKEHSICSSVVGDISMYTASSTDIYGFSTQLKNVIRVDFQEPRPFDFVYYVACIVQDFVKLTVGSSMSMSLAAYPLCDVSDIKENPPPRFCLIPQTQPFCVEKDDFDLFIRRPFLSLGDVGGLDTLGTLLKWCDKNKLNEKICRRAIYQWDNVVMFMEHWRTLTLMYDKERCEKSRLLKLIKNVGESVVKCILPKDVDFDCWAWEVTKHRNQIVVHPSIDDPMFDLRRDFEEPVFARQLEFLLKAYVIQEGLGLNLKEKKNERILEVLKLSINRFGHWDWRQQGEIWFIY